jgi:hypothetical protein
MKTWITVSTTELDSVDFSQLLNTDSSTTPKNIAGDTALIKYSGSEPSSLQNLTSKSDPLTHDQAIALLATPEWLIEEDL